MWVDDQIEETTQAAACHFGALHILVNNAARTRFSPPNEVTEDDFDDLVNTNLRGPSFGSVAAAQIVKDSGAKGSIIKFMCRKARAALPFLLCNGQGGPGSTYAPACFRAGTACMCELHRSGGDQ